MNVNHYLLAINHRSRENRAKYMETSVQIEKLVALGMTEYEAKVYIALLPEHPVTGYQVAKRAGVPRSMVYEALSRLENRGAVLKTREENAAYYRPVDPTVILDRYAETARSRAEDLKDALAPMFRRREDGKVWNFSGHNEAVRHARGLIAEATQEIMVVLGDDDLGTLADDLRAADKRGVHLGVMLTGDADFGVGEVIRHPKHETELHQLGGAILVVADEQECLIAGPGENALATATSNANLVLITRQFIWMELFSQRIFSRLGDDLLERLDDEDRRVLAGS
ncbi:MAG: hypothetical protein PF508_12720 [Spirochaeta sp.]|jgi:sugar-specific transcriptional regulator TrmB|nr:hypothetical protein [Spirochaeta sp.]